MKDFRDLKVWNRAHQLTLEVYRLTGKFSREELYGLNSQLRRCSTSIANIAEGCGRKGNGEFSRFLQIASGSACELDTNCCWRGISPFCKIQSMVRFRRS